MSRATGASPVTVEVLYFDGCPSSERLLAHLPVLLTEHGLAAEIITRRIDDDEQAQHERFPGSPTVRVNGHDVDPDASHESGYGMRCRMYRTPAGLTGVPADEWLLAAVSAAARG